MSHWYPSQAILLNLAKEVKSWSLFHLTALSSFLSPECQLCLKVHLVQDRLFHHLVALMGLSEFF
jgi:hypothetical protein